MRENPRVSDESMEARMSAVESEVVIIRREAAAARALAAGADRDVADYRGELRAHRRSLEALRQTQVEQGNSLAELRRVMESRFTEVNANVNTGLQHVNARLQHIVRLLEDTGGDPTGPAR
jgi:hypothetical protein